MATPGPSIYSKARNGPPVTGWRSHPYVVLSFTGVVLTVAVVLAFITPDSIWLWGVLLVAGVGGLMTGIVFVFPHAILAFTAPGHQRVEDLNAIRAMLIQAVGGLAAAVLGILAYQQLVATGTQVQIADQGHTDQVLTNAINDLGSASPLVRTGGAYVLKELALAHHKYRDMTYTLLVNEIRHPFASDLQPDNTGADRPPPPVDRELLQSNPEDYRGQENDKQTGQKSLRARAPDVYAALRVLMDPDLLAAGPPFSLVLDDVDLRGAILNRANFRGAFLAGARLDWADARSDDPTRRAVFQCAHLEGTSLFGAHLEFSDFRGAHFDDKTVTTPSTFKKPTEPLLFLGKARFDDSTTWDGPDGPLSREETAQRLTGLGMRHVDGRVPCS